MNKLIAAISKAFTDCFTEKDGVTWCWVRFHATWAGGVATYYLLCKTGVSLQDYGVVMTGLCAAVGYKYSREKDCAN